MRSEDGAVSCCGCCCAVGVVSDWPVVVGISPSRRNQGVVWSAGAVASGGDNIELRLICPNVVGTEASGLLTGEMAWPKIEAVGCLGIMLCCCMNGLTDPGAAAAGTKGADSIGPVSPAIGVSAGSCGASLSNGDCADSCCDGPGRVGRNNDCSTSGSASGGAGVCTVAVT